MMRNHILPTFGNVPIGLIGPVEVRRWVRPLGVDPRPAAHVRAHLGRELDRVDLAVEALRPLATRRIAVPRLPLPSVPANAWMSARLAQTVTSASQRREKR